MEIPKDRKMTFVEYLALTESDDNSIDESWLKHFKKNLPEMLNSENTKEHAGDCTNLPCACILCSLESMLKEYKEYFFDKETKGDN